MGLTVFLFNSERKLFTNKMRLSQVFTHEFSFLQTLKMLSIEPLLKLPVFTKPLTLVIEGLEGSNISLFDSSSLFITRFHVKAVVYNQHLSLTSMIIESSKGCFHVAGNIQMCNQWPVNLICNLKLKIDPWNNEKIILTISGKLYEELCAQLDFSGLFTAQLTLKIMLAQIGMPLQLSLDSKKLQWPLVGCPEYLAQRLIVRMKGEGKDYQIMLQSTLSGTSIPSSDMTIIVKGNTDGLITSKLGVGVLNGHIDMMTIIDWKRTINWRSELCVKNIDAFIEFPTCPIRLAGKVIACGTVNNGKWALEVPEINFSGDFLHNFLTICGSMNCNINGEWQIPQLLLKLGDNFMEITGNIKNDSCLNFMFKFLSINQLMPRFSGSVQGNITLSGCLKWPQMLADIDINDLDWMDKKLTIRRISLKGECEYNDFIQGNLKFQLDEIKQEFISVDQLIIIISGDERRHCLDFIVYDGSLFNKLHFYGSFDAVHKIWNGAFRNISSFSLFNQSQFMQDQDIIIDYQDFKKDLFLNSVFCNKFCHVSDFLYNIRSNVISNVLDEYFFQNKVYLNDKITQNSLSNVTRSIYIDLMTLQIKFNNRKLFLRWLIKTTENGIFNGEIGFLFLKNQPQISGNINIKNISLSCINPLLSSQQNIDGLLNLNLSLNGYFYQPQIYGEIKLKYLVITSKFIPFFINNSDLLFKFYGTNAVLCGLIKTVNDGQLYLHGNVDWTLLNFFHASIKIKGEQVAINLPLMQLIIYPDIVFTANAKQMTCNGQVNIPWARVKIKDFPQSMVKVSSESLIVDENFNPILVSSDNMVTSIVTNLIIHLGDDVSVDAFGLLAKLKGDLEIIRNKKKIISVKGNMCIPKGRFSAYGQDLIIRKGELLFSGLLDRIYLDIEAIRDPDFTEDGIVVGVQVTGLINQPKLKVFSDPVISQQEALSYLLRGHGLLNVSDINSNIITSIFIRMGIAQGEKFVDKFGKFFGVGNLSLNTKGIGDKSQVVVSGYITPGLQIKYGVGIFDSLAILTLRYRLLSEFYLEVVSGFNQSFDLLYHFEY